MATFLVILTEPDPSEYKNLTKGAQKTFFLRYNDDIRKRLISWIKTQGLEKQIRDISEAGALPALTVDCKNIKIASRLKQVDGVVHVLKDFPFEGIV